MGNYNTAPFINLITSSPPENVNNAEDQAASPIEGYVDDIRRTKRKTRKKRKGSKKSAVTEEATMQQVDRGLF